MIDTVVSGAVASYVIFSQHFSQLLSDFLLFVIVWERRGALSTLSTTT